MTDRDTLIALLNSWVTVTNPHGAAWSGRLLALGDRPCVDIEDRRGHRMCLPQEFDIQRAEEPEPLCHCGHRRDRHTPRPGIGWPLAACDDCSGDEERAWRHPYTPAPARVPVAADGTLRQAIAEAPECDCETVLIKGETVPRHRVDCATVGPEVFLRHFITLAARSVVGREDGTDEAVAAAVMATPEVQALIAERDDALTRAEQLEELLAIAHQTSNTAEAARQRASEDAKGWIRACETARAERDTARAALARVREVAAHLDASDAAAVLHALDPKDIP